MEDYLNGERFTREDMIYFARYYAGVGNECSTGTWLGDWLKGKQSK